MNTAVITAFILFVAVTVANGFITDDLKQTQAINAKLCEAGTHDDATSAKFFACYANVTGGKQYVECQNKVYGVQMDTEAHVDVVCKANKFPAYASCLGLKFAANFINPIAALRELNACQGEVMGVEA